MYDRHSNEEIERLNNLISTEQRTSKSSQSQHPATLTPRDPTTLIDWTNAHHVISKTNSSFNENTTKENRENFENSMNAPRPMNSYEDSLRSLSLTPSPSSVSRVTPSAVQLPTIPDNLTTIYRESTENLPTIPDVVIRASTSVGYSGAGYPGGVDNCGFCRGNMNMTMVCYETREGSAKSGKDFVASSGTLVSF